MEKKEVKLTEEQLDNIREDKIMREIRVIDLRSQVERTAHRLETGFNQKILEEELRQMREALETGKDSDGREIRDFMIDDIRKQVEIKEREVADGRAGLEESAARNHLQNLKETLEREEKNLSIIEKQLETGIAVTTE